MHAYERWMLQRYLANALKTRRYRDMSNIRGDFIEWISDSSRYLELPALGFRWGADDPERLNRPKIDSKACWTQWRAAAIAKANIQQPQLSPLQKRIDWLGDACELNASQRFILGLLVRINRVPRVMNLVKAVNNSLDCSCSWFDDSELSYFFDRGVERKDVSDESHLARFGLIRSQNDNFALSDLPASIIAEERLTSSRVRDLLLGSPAAASLAWEDFAHLGDMRDLAARMLAQGGKAVPASREGVNILLYGAPGTGKSEFAKTLAAHMGLSAHFVGETDPKDCEPNRRERIAALMIANAIGAAGPKTLLAVDEADDLFAGVDETNAATRHGSKVFMNRLVERTKAPTIWIVNNIERLGPAVVRRMNLVVRFPKPSLAMREKMIERIATRSEFRLDAAEKAKLAYIPAAPALIENAIRSAARIKGSAREAQQILECGLTAMGLREIAAPPAAFAFDPALSSADTDLCELASRVEHTPSKALSFCLSGPPGTGKSAYARFLAQKLGMEILDKRYSDLVSSYLGESEKAIARAFEEAADMRAFLILDEADSLLRDRGAARYSWEITQVNEMLTHMERHPYPFACTTNALDLMDPATARRFLFKVRFLPMSGDQIANAFQRAFGVECPPSLRQLDHLTPGDFTVVARKAEVFGERDTLRLAAWLEEEVSAKPEGKRMKIGF